MTKKIKVLLKGTIEIPDKADIIRFRDEDKIETDHLRIGGRLFRPYFSWMEYSSSAILKKRDPNYTGGQGWETTDDQILGELLSIDEEWYLEVVEQPETENGGE